MLNSGILALRRRSLWEAADMGLLLWRRNLGYLILFFAIPFWVCAFTLLLPAQSGLADLLPGSLGKYPLLCAWFVLWWLNPLFDRLTLHVVAMRYFEPRVPFRGLFRGLGAGLCRGLAGDLLWRRFSPWRAAVLPLRVLERGSPARVERTGNRKRRRIAARKRALAGGGLHFCIFLSAWCVLLQWLLVAGELLFAYFVSRIFFSSTWNSRILLGEGGLYLYTIWCVNYLVVESLYVCMGFGLYLNSRVEVEGWDIELLFRKFATRYRKAGALVLLLFGLGLPRLTGLFGQSAGPDPLPPDLGMTMPVEILEEILEQEMEGERKTWGIRFKSEDTDSPDSPGIAPFPWVNFFRDAGALILRGVLVLVFAALVLVCGIFVYRRRKHLLYSAQPPDTHSSRTVPAPTPAPTPEFLLEEADHSYRQGLIREAWGLCYAASLEALTRYHRIRFPPGATEYRCLALYQGSRQAGLKRAFADLIRHWVALAYGGISPPAGAFEDALAWAQSLCGPPQGSPAAGNTPAAGNSPNDGGPREAGNAYV
jgi:hypothetical protein